VSALARLLADPGGICLVEGPAGVGKSRLLAEARALADAAGAAFAGSRGTELERPLAFGVVAQLFQPLLAALTPERRGAVLAGAAAQAAPVLGLAPPPLEPLDPATTMHGLYWLAVALVAERPLVLAVDDAHWADSASLGWLAHLALRLEGMPVTVLVVTRTAGETGRPPELAALLASPRVGRIWQSAIQARA